MSAPNIEAFKEFVGKIDSDGNGYITPVEFKIHFKFQENKFGITLTDEQVEKAIAAMDKDGDGMFSIKEVIDWMVSAGYLPKMQGLGLFTALFAAVAGSVIPAIVGAVA